MDNDHDLFTRVAGTAFEGGKTFYVTCNCGGRAPLTPPLKTEFVICPNCIAKIKVEVMPGDPGYMLARRAGKEVLTIAQGSSAKPPHELSEAEQQSIIAEIKRQAG